MDTKKLWFLVILMVAIALGLTTYAQSVHAESTLEVVKKRGKILLGVKTDYAPFAYLDKSKKFAGFDVEIWKVFADRLGVQLEFVPITSASRIPMLVNGTIDVVSGGTTHTLKRDEVVDFSITYFMDGMRILVRKDSGIKSVKDVIAASKEIAMVQGGSQVPVMLKLYPDGKYVYFQEYPQAVLALKEGKIATLVSTEVMLGEFVKKYPELEVVGEFLSLDPYAMVVRENDSDWRDWINFSLLQIWDDGTYARLYRKIFGKEPEFKMEFWVK